jgi:hygromycin-B 4-O-kinase
VDKASKISAIIDWEHCVSSIAPHWDLSVALHDLSIDAKEEFLAGYGLTQKEFRHIAPVIKALNIINYAPYVESMGASKGGKQLLEQYRTRLSGAFDLYSL